MTMNELKVHALDRSINRHVSEPSRSAAQVVQDAREFEAYLSE